MGTRMNRYPMTTSSRRYGTAGPSRCLNRAAKESVAGGTWMGPPTAMSFSPQHMRSVGRRAILRPTAHERITAQSARY